MTAPNTSLQPEILLNFPLSKILFVLRGIFRDAHIPFPNEDARELILATTQLSQADLIAYHDETLDKEAVKTLCHYATRRLSGEPVDHILGEREFYGRSFNVNRHVLSPRADTENLISEILKLLKDIQSPTILDLGTGSGAIIITLLSERLDATGTATDLSKAALKIAQSNANRHNVSPIWLHGSWFEPVNGQFNVVVSNPPYITSAAMEELETEVKLYDPPLALHGGKDGLTAYRNITSKAFDYLRPEGWLVFEIGCDQAQSVKNILENVGFEQIRFIPDLSGHDRGVLGRKPSTCT